MHYDRVACLDALLASKLVRYLTCPRDAITLVLFARLGLSAEISLATNETLSIGTAYISVTFLSYISNACHSLSGVAERLQHTSVSHSLTTTYHNINSPSKHGLLSNLLTCTH